MATFINEVQILGNITRDVELKTTQNSSIAVFSVATNRYFKDKVGNQKEEAEFHNITAWGKLAELCHKYLNKGSRVLLKGRLKTRSWDGEDGKKNYRTEIVAQDVFFIGRTNQEKSEDNPEHTKVDDLPL